MSNQASTSTSGIKTKQTISNNQTWPNNSSKANVSSSSKGARNLVSPIIPDIREYLFKLLVIGELGTGKTSFVKRYIGVDFALKVLNWDENTLIRAQLWDIAGQERFGNMTRVYYKEAVGAFLVFDVNSPQTFNAVLKWKHDLDMKVCLADGNPIPCLLLANKCDSPKEGSAASPEVLDKFVKENNFCGWFYTSAKENINVEEAAKFLVDFAKTKTFRDGGHAGKQRYHKS
ncbi:hypothetical protein RDWZM_004023 [Blomia tropicalis]|uniref:Ras-related protein Rab n=1 Tax=Blomia tropicalis TaxID=40697 RepID=A0A9Q0MHZ4_BLOTA|nr:hypothetical protein RDWZM_004023 [Blomia tropicalis]